MRKQHSLDRAVLLLALFGLALSAPSLAAGPLRLAQVRSPDAGIGSYFNAPKPPPPPPVYGPRATTGTAMPGAPTGGVDPELYPGGDGIGGDRNAEIGRSLPRVPQLTAQSGRKARINQNDADGKVAECMALWDKGTHMTQADWRRSCVRSLRGADSDSRKTRR